MTHVSWKDYLDKYKSDVCLNKQLIRHALSDWNKNIEKVNEKLNQLQDEIDKLIERNN